MDQFVKEFRDTIEVAKSELLRIPSSKAADSERGKWSAKQVVGHLIDSAANNHQRFVRAQFSDDLVCPGYDQEKWVEAQKYNDAPWPDLVHLWAAYNLHLCHLVSVIPEQALTIERREHNLDQIAWKAVDRNTPTTLEYFVKDYAGHMRHHLRQILGDDFEMSN